MSRNYLRISDAVTSLAAGMWSGLPPPDPVVLVKSSYLKASVVFGPRRDQAGQCLTSAVLNGELSVYVSVDPKKPDPAIVPLHILKRLITLRGCLPDRAFRPSRKIAAPTGSL